ncbi:aspartic peptidase domain-containing protein [Mycena polygramma]|nr:aspartic peptidase domain-containing protein [Mycena polygramma]
MWISSASLLPFVLLFSSPSVQSLALHAKRVTPSKGATFVTTSNATLQGVEKSGLSQQSRYATNVTVNGQNFLVAIDTGSSDFWISPPADIMYTNTGVQTSIGYVAPSTVNGPIALGTVELGGYSFDQQAFVPAAPADVKLGGVLEIGLNGLIGFAFGGTSASPISASLIAAGHSKTAGQPFLFNIFDQSPDTDNFIAISLSRTDDSEGTAHASFLINELDETYSAVANSTPIPIFQNSRWNLPLDGISVNGKPLAMPASVVSNNNDKKPIMLMDSGTPSAFFPVDLFNSIYGSIPGALYSTSAKQWVVPCNTTAIVTVVLEGQSFPIHPLDLSDLQVIEGVTVCTSAFAFGPGNADFDGLFGDSILRNMYSVSNFGSAIAKSPTPASNMQLLSQTDPVAAAADVLNVRMAALQNSPYPEGIPPSYGPLTFLEPQFAAAIGSSPADTDAQVEKYAPIVIGLLGANLFILLILAVFGLIACVKWNGKAGTLPAKYTPVRLREGGLGTYEDKPYSDTNYVAR